MPNTDETSLIDDPVRVLLVDDSVFTRRLIAEALRVETRIEVVGKAANGRTALERIRQLEPELVLLDVEMPVMGGIETLTHLQSLPQPPKVIMFSSFTEDGASVTLEALALGASDYVRKPNDARGMNDWLSQVREQLIPKMLALVPRHRSQTDEPITPPTLVRRRVPSVQMDVVLIGCSTGGPNALMEVIPRLSPELPVPVLIVQHMPPMFTQLLAERLDQHGPLPATEAADGEELKSGHVYVAPGGLHLEVNTEGNGRPTARLHDGAPVNSCRPAVDVLFQSAATVFGASTLATVLTGMGSDGTLGCQAVRDVGGQVIVQNKESSLIWGMPGAVAKAGLADEILPLNEIASRIQARVSQGRSAATTAGEDHATSERRGV